MIVVTHSRDETIELGRRLAKVLPKGSVVCLLGDLAAGKTTLMKGLVSSLTGAREEDVISPTFVLLNIYEGPLAVYHFDLYRLKGSDEFLSMGFDEYLHAGGVSCIEWSERILDILPKNALFIELKRKGEEVREIRIEGIEL